MAYPENGYIRQKNNDPGQHTRAYGRNDAEHFLVDGSKRFQ
jgi:hypothetical protein